MGCLKLAHWNEMEIPAPLDRTENESPLRCVWRFSGGSKIGVNCYDYGARFYDPSLGRWFVPDIFSEYHFNQSPYNYALNNPYTYINPFGLDTLKIDPNTDEMVPIPLPGAEIIHKSENNESDNNEPKYGVILPSGYWQQ